MLIEEEECSANAGHFCYLRFNYLLLYWHYFFKTKNEKLCNEKEKQIFGKPRYISTLLLSKTKPREIDLHEGNEGEKTGSENHKATNKKIAKKN